MDFVRRWSEKTEIGAGRFIGWLDITASKFYDWRERYGKVNEHNGWVPRDFWLEDWEKQAIIGFHLKNPLEGYRRLTFMMLDADIVAVSPTSVWRVLGQAGLLSKWNGKLSQASLDIMFHPWPNEGYGWHVRKDAGGRRLKEKTGGHPSYAFDLLHYPDDQVTIIWATNSLHKRFRADLNRRLCEAVLGVTVAK